jgi:hypothetical protein
MKILGTANLMGSPTWMANKYHVYTGGLRISKTGIGLAESELRQLKEFTKNSPVVEVSISEEAKALYMSMIGNNND